MALAEGVYEKLKAFKEREGLATFSDAVERLLEEHRRLRLLGVKALAAKLKLSEEEARKVEEA